MTEVVIGLNSATPNLKTFTGLAKSCAEWASPGELLVAKPVNLDYTMTRRRWPAFD